MRLTILFAEDHATVRLVVAEMLESAGFRVVACTDGKTALACLESDAGYDLLIFDNILPGLNGVELTPRVRSLAHRRHTPILFLSASEVRAEAIAAGADVFLRKPEDIMLIVETAKTLIQR